MYKDLSLLRGNEFKQGICGCFSNFDSCCCSLCCPCIETGYIAEELGENFFLFCVGQLYLPWFPVTYLRQKVRERNNIEGSLAEDALMSCCCTFCAISQCATELDIHIIR
ncbi:Protein PLANT CADMIUM RESISTANCE 1 [Thelohanellus kitauei]|uniref:Protein PLANT CADMIUM RESISTANCE 1 n=1 Tax=Thelohanellus kitauei TaxID=669202 RepID=A0A0C2JAZ9_THEKT|nr:Protein PLANT CADMIUM RESISTANCE 1 [Thelohanellus kitauei]